MFSKPLTVMTMSTADGPAMSTADDHALSQFSTNQKCSSFIPPLPNQLLTTTPHHGEL